MTKGSIDEVSLVKAAAWAWHHHGSGCEGRPVREFDILRTSRLPRPSRYKLEAMRNKASISEEEGEEDGTRLEAVSLTPAHTDMSLLDSYEIESISRQLKHIVASAEGSSLGLGLGGIAMVDGGRDGVRSRASPKKKEMVGVKVNGFLARHAIGFCTSRGGVVEAAAELGMKPRTKRSSSVRLVAQ